jgi:hypothetical protein
MEGCVITQPFVRCNRGVFLKTRQHITRLFNGVWNKNQELFTDGSGNNYQSITNNGPNGGYTELNTYRIMSLSIFDTD